jgi:VanZ family protein
MRLSHLPLFRQKLLKWLPFMLASAAWAALAVVGYATLSPVRVVYRVYETLAPSGIQPGIETYVHIEHLGAFLMIGILFGWAYPRHTVLVVVFVVGMAAAFEVLQALTPDRHGRLPDAIEKMAGAAVGVLLARLSSSAVARLMPRRLPAAPAAAARLGRASRD